MFIALAIIAGMAIIAAVALYVWTRRSERTIDYAAMESGQTEDERRARQFGVATSSITGMQNN